MPVPRRLPLILPGRPGAVARPATSSPAPFVPKGHPDNSPAIHCWGGKIWIAKVAQGRLSLAASF